MYNKINTGQVYKKEIVSKIKEKTGFWKKDIELMLLALGEVITEGYCMCFSIDNLICVNQKTKRRTKLCTYVEE